MQCQSLSEILQAKPVAFVLVAFTLVIAFIVFYAWRSLRSRRTKLERHGVAIETRVIRRERFDFSEYDPKNSQTLLVILEGTLNGKKIEFNYDATRDPVVSTYAKDTPVTIRVNPENSSDFYIVGRESKRIDGIYSLATSIIAILSFVGLVYMLLSTFCGWGNS